MIIAIPTSTSGEKSFVSEHFSKCNYFYIFDTETNEGHAYNNKFKKNSHGGGRSVANFLLSLGAKVIIVKEMGPGAMESVGDKAEVFKATDKIVKENIDSYLKQELKKLN